MKVLLLCNNYPPEFTGGTERVVQALAHGLGARGDEVCIVAGTEAPGGGGRAEVDGTIAVHRIGLGAGEGYGLEIPRPRIQRLVAGHIERLGIDVVHVHHWSHLSDGLVRLARRHGCGTVVTLHDMWTSCARFFRLPPAGITCPEDDGRDACVGCANLDLQESAEEVRAAMARRDAVLTAELLAADAITAPSADCARACREHRPWPGGPPPIEVVPHGLLDDHPPPPRGPLGLPLRVGTFGNLNREKGVLDLVEAMAGQRAELHLFGGGRDTFRAEVASRAAALGLRSTWHGAYSGGTPHPALGLDLAVFPSRCRETYGLVVDEALHHGTPVVVADSGALPERIARGGGMAVPPGDVAALAATLRGLIDDRDALHRLRASIPGDFPHIGDAIVRYRHLYAKAWAASRARR